MKRGTKGSKMLPYEIGQRVMAQFPGSTTLWYEAQILFNVGKYKVEFEDGTQHQIAPEGVRPIEEEEEEYRGRSVKRKKSPARTPAKKSPGRPKAKSKSPVRIRRSSRSPARTTQKPASPARPRGARAVTPTRQSNRVKQREETERTTVASTSGVESVDGRSIRDGLRARTNDVSNNNRTPVQVALQKGAVLGSAATPNVMNNLLHTDGANAHRAKPERYFGGTIGTFLLFFVAPAFVLAINLMCTKRSCTILSLPALPLRLSDWFDLLSLGIFLAWVLIQAILYSLPIGRLVEGQRLPNGKRLRYRMNGIPALLISLAGVGAGCFYYPRVVNIIVAKRLQMLVSSLLVSLLFSVLLFLKARKARPDQLSDAGSAGGHFYGFFMGRELNPRLFGFELKMFLELRPGLIGLAALLVMMVAKDFRENNGMVNLNLVLLVIFQLIYVADALFFEKSILTTMDVTTEGLGFMLTFGDLCFVPFVFGLPARFLMESRLQYNWFWLPAIAALYLVGYIIFRFSNLQKDQFRENPNGPTVKDFDIVITTQSTNILAGGLWGYLRHPNYLGDLIMALSFSLLVGHQHVIPHCYLAYLFTLLVHRAIRDEEHCLRKYGKAWEEYKRKVPSKIFPKIF